MSAPVQYAIGADVHCPDGTYGHLKRVVIEPQSARVTHLVIGGRDATDRLVPVDIVDETAGDAENIRLFRDTAAVAQLDAAEETEFLPGSEEHLGYEPGQWLTVPAAGLSGGGAVPMPLLLDAGAPHAVVHERVPGDEVQIRHGDRVEATDGEIGHVQGLLVDPRDHGTTHVLLKEGHLWGRKTVAIPINEVSWQGGTVTTRLSKAQLGELPPVRIDSRP
ncbi:PRC-barrel domain-containing protein [Kitasatospora sp. NBC_01250]|uniref:PRC-barrel domain-containing protein n=1 Tax=Kitasatospora sp. NBC_01250 TaxID=2903571 RepID=UPI002E32C38B|nr:PRC-barrel domain-containing protein [Kitasatospora sp. NBC_01250]